MDIFKIIIPSKIKICCIYYIFQSSSYLKRCIKPSLFYTIFRNFLVTLFCIRCDIRSIKVNQLYSRLDGMDRRLDGLHDKITEVEKNLGEKLTDLEKKQDGVEKNLGGMITKKMKSEMDS